MELKDKKLQCVNCETVAGNGGITTVPADPPCDDVSMVKGPRCSS